jgi:hypothetical protein
LLLAWELGRLDQFVADAFGFHALQLGLPEVDGCAPTACRTAGWPRLELVPERACRCRRRTVTTQGRRAGGLHCEFDALPFPDSIDLVVLPHTLELARDPHQTCAKWSACWCPRAAW